MSPPKPLNLAPLSQNIAINPSHVANHPMSLILKETTSGFDFDVTDRETDHQLYTIRGSIEAKTATKAVYDAKGTHLFNLVKEKSWNPKYYELLRPDGTPFVETTFKWGSKSSSSPPSVCD